MKTTALVLIVCSYIVLAETLFACKCPAPDDKPFAELVSAELNGSTAVFQGTVADISPSRLNHFVTIKVHHAWKGVEQSVIRVWTGVGHGDCGYPFEVGKTYLVYAGGKLDRLSTDICTRTNLFSNAFDEYKLLGKPSWSASVSSNK